MMNPKKRKDKIFQIMNNPEKVRQIIQLGINDALLKHKRANNPVCGGKNGQIFWINPKNIPVRKK